ncbi:MAG TPA: hypothetical protein VMZ53_24735, partial [Kofleriaceae bacterium]|nr:hypothetical protein [Kofleriaceae bacterium]
MRSFVNAALLSLVVACGGESHQHTGIDALPSDTGGSDGLPPGCDYLEQRDATNDDVFPSPGTPEATNLTIGNKTTICGGFQHTHFDGSITVDVDGYFATVASDADVLVRIAGTGADAVELVGVDVYPMGSTATAGKVTFYGDHGVASVHLAAGTYELLPFALNSTAITSTIDYKLELAAGSLDTRCALIPSGGYTEASDGTGSTGNDVVAFPTSGAPMLTASGSDNPESTNVTVTATSNNRFSGSAADVTADKYEDKDTFAFVTGAANELTVRLGWTGAANPDFFIFEAGSAAPVWRADGTTGTA